MSRWRLAALLGIAALVPFYQRDRRAALKRLRASSQVISTPAGPVEYAVTGSGYPVVVLHGAGGGYEQGLLTSSLLDPDQYQIIAPTRAGYRRTPLATAPTFEAQADCIAHILDALNIEAAAVLA